MSFKGVKMEVMYEGYKKLKSSEIYKNYERNKKLFDGKSSEVFYNAVLSRVKLEYMGVIDSNNKYYEFVREGNTIVRREKSFKDLIVGNNILGSITKLYAELASNSEPTINLEEEKKNILEKIDLQDKTSEAVAIQSYGGKLLLKGFIVDNSLYLDIIAPHQYFVVPSILSEEIIEKYVIFTEEKRTLKAEIYSEGCTEYRMYKISDQNFEEIDYEVDLTQYGATKDGKGWKKVYKGWQVVEVHNLFKRSDYVEDLVILNRELVVGDTLTSQAFDKVANPLLQVPEGALEYDEEGNLTVKINDRVIIVDPEDKDLKQVELKTKTEEWKTHRTGIIEQIYIATGTNEQAFGLNKNGIPGSGEAKRRDLERIISTVITKRDRVFAGFEKIIKWGYSAIYNGELDITISGKDILSLGVGEKIIIAVQGITSGILSIESAIKYVNVADVDITEEIKRLKNDLAYKTKLIEALQTLSQLDTEERVAGLIKKQADELIEELGLNE